MNEPKLIHCVLGSILSWCLAGWSWATGHLPLILQVITTVFAIYASLWTVRASKAKYRRMNRDRDKSYE